MKLTKPARRTVPALFAPGPVWPLNLEMARAGCGIGVLLAQHHAGKVSVVTVDLDGVLVMLATLDSMKKAVRWCVERHVRILWSLGGLIDAMRAGRCLGWVPDRIVEHSDGRTFVPVAVPFPFSLESDSDHGVYIVSDLDPVEDDDLG